LKTIFRLLILIIPFLLISCYKQKACFEENKNSGQIVKVLGNCKKDGGGDFAEIAIDDAYVYLSDATYKRDVSQGGLCNFENIDFNLYSLVGCEVTYLDSAFFNRQITIDHTNKIIHYNIIVTSSKRRFQFRNRVFAESNMVLIPKISKDYILETLITETSCD